MVKTKKVGRRPYSRCRSPLLVVLGLFNSGIGDDLSSDDQLTVILIAVGAVVCCIIICGVLVCACVYYAMGSKNDYVQPNQTYNGNYNGSQHRLKKTNLVFFFLLNIICIVLSVMLMLVAVVHSMTLQ